MTASVSVRGLRFAYPGGTFSLDVPSLDIEAGERVACIGPSGCGKTTLIQLLCGILEPTAGAVHVFGREVTGMPDDARRHLRRSEVGMVFQDFELLDYLSARENVMLPFLLGADRPAEGTVGERVAKLAETTGISHVLDRKPRGLSQGERQRVALCRALITEPPLIVGDEPTGNLDPKTSDQIVDLLFERAESLGATVLMVTHDHALLSRFDRVLDMMELVTS